MEGKGFFLVFHLLYVGNKPSLADREGTHGGFIFSGDIGGSVSNMLFLFSYQHAEFIAIDEQPDHDIMQQDRFRKTDRLSH
jgi:hypothetical protein